MKKKATKLTLSKDTLHRLADGKLRAIRGGVVVDSDGTCTLDCPNSITECTGNICKVQTGPRCSNGRYTFC
jgi:hypothetical protein